MNLKPYPQYFENNLPWLEQIPIDWKIIRAKNIFTPVDNRSESGQEELLSVSEKAGVTPRKQVNVTMFKAESYVGYKLCWERDLVINSLWAWMQGLGFSRYHGIISSAYGVYRLKDQLESDFKYFHYLLRSKAYLWELRVNSKGIWRSRYQLTDESFFRIPIVIPPEQDRRQIARYLEWKTFLINKFIRAKKRQIELLKEQKQVIINDAVTGKIDVQTGSPYTKYKGSGVDWLEMIPDEWGIYSFKHLARFNPSKGETGLNSDSTEPVVFLPMEKVTNDGVIDCSLKLPFKEISNGFSYFKKGDVVIAKITPCFENGKGAFLENLETEFGFGTTEFITLRPGELINGNYLRLILSSNWFLKIGEQHMTGSAGQKRVSTDFIKSFLIGIPSISDQDIISSRLIETIKVINATINKIQNELNLIQEYCNGLIADTVTGKVDVRDIVIPEFHIEHGMDEDEIASEAEEEMEETTLDND